MNKRVRLFRQNYLEQLETLLCESIRSCNALVALSIEEQRLWRAGRIPQALKILGRKRTALEAYRHLETLRHSLRDSQKAPSDNTERLTEEVRKHFRTLQQRNAFLELVNQNTMRMARLRLKTL